MKPWVKYSLVRVGIFAVVLVILVLFGIQLWISAIVAAIIGLCVAYIFFGKLRDAMALEIANRRAMPVGTADADAAAEDAEAGAGDSGAAAASAER